MNGVAIGRENTRTKQKGGREKAVEGVIFGFRKQCHHTSNKRTNSELKKREERQKDSVPMKREENPHADKPKKKKKKRQDKRRRVEV